MIDTKIEQMEKSGDKEKFAVIRTQANTMLENVKHSIVLLQIAKNTVHPINGRYQGPPRSLEPEAQFETATPGIAFGAECMELKSSEGSQVDGKYRIVMH